MTELRERSEYRTSRGHSTKTLEMSLPQGNMLHFNLENSRYEPPITQQCPMCGQRSIRHALRAPDRFHGRREMYDLARCSDCGLVWLIEPPDPQEMPNHYSNDYHQTIECAGETELLQRWQRQCDSVLELSAVGGAILDIGCSSGAFLRTLTGRGRRLYGVEISEREAERARIAANAEIFVGDPLAAPFAPASFDVITCFHLLEHVHSPFEMLKRIRTWLKPGGYLYIILPNIDSWEARIFRSYWYGLELPRHIWHFSPSSLDRAVNTAKMRTVRLRTLFQDSFSEHSCHYIVEDLVGRCGISKTPLAAGYTPSLPVKIIRKMFRLTIESVFRYTASLAGRGASIEGVFVKEG